MAEDKKDNVVLIRQPPLKRGDRRLLERAQALFELQEQLCVATSAIRRLQALDDAPQLREEGRVVLGRLRQAGGQGPPLAERRAGRAARELRVGGRQLLDQTGQGLQRLRSGGLGEDQVGSQLLEDLPRDARAHRPPLSCWETRGVVVTHL